VPVTVDVCPAEELPPGHVKIVWSGPIAIGVYNCGGKLYALDALAELPWVTTYGPPAERRAGIISFNVDEIHPHDIAQILDMDAVAIRAGHHCCQPLMRNLGVVATNRASFYLYTTTDEIDRLVAGLHRARQVFA
jgi:cysteine desulfurase/selenocysteine lyase